MLSFANNLKKNGTNIARPSIIKIKNNDYRMWYSYISSKTSKYRIGYAFSKNCIDWKRQDNKCHFNFDGKIAKQMLCYPNVFKFKNDYYILFNGDNFGHEGFGISKIIF